jgi:hypothetical protein
MTKSAETKPSGSPSRTSGAASRHAEVVASTAKVGVAIACRPDRAARSTRRVPSSTSGTGVFVAGAAGDGRGGTTTYTTSKS